MQFICEGAQDLTWFRIDSESEAAQESSEMNHAVVKHFCQARAAVEALWKPPAGMRYIEQDIGKKDFVERGMPLFATLRDAEGKALATAMLRTEGAVSAVKSIVVGHDNSDPYPQFSDSIEALGRHLGLELDRASCFPYRRG